MSNGEMSQRLQDEGRWQQFKERAAIEWGGLTDEELESSRGSREQFVATVKKKTGESADSIDRKYQEWTSSF